MSKLRILAGQTAVYGISSILGRIINYFLVGLHTAVFLLDEMGVVSELYGTMALLLIVITFGMETTFFRFYTKTHDKHTYHVAATLVVIISLAVALLISLQPEHFGRLILGSHFQPEHTILFQLLAGIILIDGLTAIPFARLRLENKPVRFAITKITAILANILLQILFLLIFPAIHNNEYLPWLKPLVDTFYNPHFGIEYIFIANLLSNLLYFPLLAREFLLMRPSIKWPVLKPMLLYTTPLVLTGIAGWFVSDLDKLAVAWWATDGLSNQGVYTQTFKLGALMMLAIQAFRYAAEPFFFAQASDRQAPQLYARTLHYFVIFGLLLLLGVSLNIDWIAPIFLRKAEFRTALYLVPIIMFGKLLYGVYINISIWYKLKDKTHYGLLFTGIGAVVALAANYLLLPLIGILGSALAIVLSYGAMSLACYLLGRKYMPIPYRFAPLAVYTLIFGGLVLGGFLIKLDNPIWDTTLNLLVSAIAVMLVYLLERKNLLQPT